MMGNKETGSTHSPEEFSLFVGSLRDCNSLVFMLYKKPICFIFNGGKLLILFICVCVLFTSLHTLFQFKKGLFCSGVAGFQCKNALCVVNSSSKERLLC